jgi:hypothetical protein
MISGAMLIEDMRHHYGHHHNDEGPDFAIGAYSFSAPCFELGTALIYLLDGHARVESGQVQFVDENGGGPGVHLRKRQRAKPTK